MLVKLPREYIKTISFIGPTHYVRGVKFTSHVVEDDLYAKPIQGRHHDTLIIDDPFEETQMPRTKRLKNKPSTKVNEVKVSSQVKSDISEQVQTPVSPSPLPPINKYDVEPSNFHARYILRQGAAQLVAAAEEYETLARLLRNTANSLNRVHE